MVAMPAIRWHTAMPPMRYGRIPICIVMVVVGIIPRVAIEEWVVEREIEWVVAPTIESISRPWVIISPRWCIEE